MCCLFPLILEGKLSIAYFSLLPGERPSASEMKAHTQIQQNPHMNLIPVKLAFALLVHKVENEIDFMHCITNYTMV